MNRTTIPKKSHRDPEVEADQPLRRRVREKKTAAVVILVLMLLIIVGLIGFLRRMAGSR